MRIQHNIMAMTAYRNYTNNVSAMKANLEKLSSGYKINRAGDDAAGLAISEKMRAQITGLETAQKNAKDGISLVQTAEGALTEVHDMLNRMVELATQSANGTYDNDTDRYQLQKEMDQLRAEIDRIADSSNFNGIQLLDGSMDAGGDVVYTEGSFQFAAEHPAGISTSDITLPPVGSTLGTNSVLHADGVTGSDTNAFSVDLHNLTLLGGGSVEIALGNGDTITVENSGNDPMTAEQIVSKIVASVTGSADSEVTDSQSTAVTADSFSVGGGTFKITGSGTRLTFTQTDDADVTIPDTVTITDPDAGTTNAVADKYVTGAVTYASNGGASTATKATVTYTDASGTTQTADVTFAVATDDATTATNLVNALKGDSTLSGLFDISGDENGISFEAKTAGAGKGAVTGIAIVDETGKDTVTVGGKDASSVTGADAGTTDSKLSGDYNVTTTVIQTKQDPSAERLASTYFTLSDKMVTEGSTITIGNDTYTFTTDSSKIGKDGYVVYNAGDATAKIAEKLTEAAKGNKTYTVGTDGTGKITITEVPGQTNFDLTTMAGIEKSLGFKTATTNPVDTSKGLTLQIGDTADSYNQLKVNIKDCHCSGLGIADISIANQDDAAAAVDAIKKAINYVSDVRGTLGATQNRLDHTINNLSVMTENIQDAESTIRDVDVAEEMMAYTKNNILIQASQAMLAQANQVPQGVLQLLQ